MNVPTTNNEPAFVENLALKWSIFLDVLLDYGVISASQREEGKHSARVIRLYELFETNLGRWDDKEKFVNWCVACCKSYLRFASFRLEEKMTVSVTRHYGAVSVTLGLESSFYLTDGTSRNVAFSELTAHVHDLHRAYASEHLIKSVGGSARAVGSQPETVNPDGVPAGHEKIKIDEIWAEKKGKKTYYKVRGGKYTEYGVRVWSEVLDEAGITDEMIGDSLVVSGYAIIKLNSDGKPEKVVSIKIE